MAALLGGDVELVTITTAGDVDRARGDKSRWVGALEAALLAGEIDLAVHSAKDVPGELAAGTAIVATPRRARAVRRARRRRAGACARARGSAPARCAGARSCSRRGRTSRSSSCAATSTRGCASAPPARSTRSCSPPPACERLGRRGEAGALLIDGVFVPAAGQGVIAVQAPRRQRRGGARPRADHAATHAAWTRSAHVVRALGATCHTPVGVLAAATGRVRAFVGLPDGSEWLVEEAATGATSWRARCSPPAPTSCCARRCCAVTRLPRRRRARATRGC